MPNRYVEYLDRPVRVGKDERQREKLRNAAHKQLDKIAKDSKEKKGCWMTQKARRALLCVRLNQRHVTYEEALAQTRAIERYVREH